MPRFRIHSDLLSNEGVNGHVVHDSKNQTHQRLGTFTEAIDFIIAEDEYDATLHYEGAIYDIQFTLRDI